MRQNQKSAGQTRNTKRGQRTDPDVRAEVERLSLEGWWAAAIHRKLTDDQRFRGRVPEPRTIQNLVRQATPRDPSGVWVLAEATAENARLVLPVLAEVLRRTDGRKSHLTRGEGDWISRLGGAVPDLPGWWVYELAHRYMRRLSRELPTSPFDELLAFAPWRGEPEFERYMDFVASVHEDWLPGPKGELSWDTYEPIQLALRMDIERTSTTPLRVVISLGPDDDARRLQRISFNVPDSRRESRVLQVIRGEQSE